MNIKTIKNSFPIFTKKINGKELVYLDSANSSQKPKAVKMLETKIIVITEKNLPEVIKKVKAGMGEFVIYGLDPASFKNLALNFEEIKRYIEQQKEVILYYEEAVKPKDNK